MKTKILLFLTLLSLVGCSKDDPKPPEPQAQLPPETQTGANTFGCNVNNQLFYPRDGRYGTFPSGSINKAIKVWGAPGGMQEFNEIEIINGVTRKPISSMIIHLQGLNAMGIGIYNWNDTNFQSSIDGPMENYLYCSVYNYNSNTYENYGSYNNSGKVNITRYDLPNRIVSGTFSGTLRIQNGSQLLEIHNGRFDIKWDTLDKTTFK